MTFCKPVNILNPPADFAVTNKEDPLVSLLTTHALFMG